MMGKEIEVKVLNIDIVEIEKKLKKIGAIKVKEEYQENVLFDVKDKLIMAGINGYLRMRTVEDKLKNKVTHEFTLKKVVSSDGNMRINNEIETCIDCPENLIEILKALGIPVLGRGFKERISYELDGILFEIDKWDKKTYPDAYMEIEVSSENELYKAIELLDLNRKNITTKSIDELRKDKGMK